MALMDENLLADVVSAALKAGADSAEAVGAQRAALGINVRMGELEEVEMEWMTLSEELETQEQAFANEP